MKHVAHVHSFLTKAQPGIQANTDTSFHSCESKEHFVHLLDLLWVIWCCGATLSDVFLHHSTLYASNAHVTILQGMPTLCGAILMSLQESHMIMIPNVDDKYRYTNIIYMYMWHNAYVYIYIYTPCQELYNCLAYCATLVLNTKILTFTSGIIFHCRLVRLRGVRHTAVLTTHGDQQP